MNTEQKELYQRIQEFSLDDANSQYSFSQRLAQENGWSEEYTKLAIAAYKKFTFLAVVAGHTVSPSEIIDQVWHLHLIYTQSYGQEFCPKVLGISLHHHPSRGGLIERNKYQNIYRQTLASFVLLFSKLCSWYFNKPVNNP